ncbi:MAG: hypothetical protein ACRD2T_14205, partial [Thermoanaerobaculia bacterium]
GLPTLYGPRRSTMGATIHERTFDSIYRPLWLTYGLVPFLAGLDKFYTLARLAEARQEAPAAAVAPALRERQV